MFKMKKVLEILNKPMKKKKEKFYNEDQICKDASPDPPRDLPVEIPPHGEMYRNFRFDSCCNEVTNICSSSEVSNSHGSNSVTSERDNHLEYGSYTAESVGSVPAEVLAASVDSSHIPVLQESQSLGIPRSVPYSDLESSTTRTVTPEVSRSSSESEDLSSASETDTSILCPNNSALKQITKKTRKRSNNTYIININDSRGFHIGSKKTINLGAVHKDNINAIKSQNPAIDGNNLQEDQTTREYDHLLDRTDAITPDDVSVISLYVSGNWRDIGRRLEIDESTMQELELENENNSTIIVYDMLRRFLNQYPDTSLGFIVNILKQSRQDKALQQLVSALSQTQRLNMNS